MRAMQAIEICRTAALGGHVYECESYGAQKIGYNSRVGRRCCERQTGLAL
ncbi:MAG TPA: transposase zinc-binding domain-containing protein [Thermoanaerobaculia bacterium]|nr:transposase zinc-binding domain-containing protein [Thermoanaerobaculia bacterium]